MPGSNTAQQQRDRAARSKYVELAPGRVVLNVYADSAIRLVDLESRNPDVLKEFPDTVQNDPSPPPLSPK